MTAMLQHDLVAFFVCPLTNLGELPTGNTGSGRGVRGGGGGGLHLPLFKPRHLTKVRCTPMSHASCRLRRLGGVLYAL